MDITERKLIRMYEDMLDECYPPIVIGGATYLPSAVLKAVDPIAYDQGLLNFYDALTREGYYCPEME